MGWTNTQTDSLTLPPGAGPSRARIVIGPDIPPELVVFYATFPLTVEGVLLFYDASGNYQYIGLVTHTGTGFTANLVIGKVIGGVVAEELFLDGAVGGGSFSQDLYWEDSTGNIGDGGYNLITPLNGFANRGLGYVRFQWRQVVSPAACIQVVGELTTGVVANGTVIGSIPVLQRPLAIMPLVVQCSNVPANKMTVLELNPNGDLKLFDYGAGIIGINGLYEIGTD